MWTQHYNPVGNHLLSTLIAALPIVLLLSLLAFFKVKAWWAAVAGLGAAFLIAIVVYGMPATAATGAMLYGSVSGLFPIGWLVFTGMLIYNMSVETGEFKIVQKSIISVSADRRIQAVLIAFVFGAFLEGCAGFGAPVAISAALMIGLGFNPIYAAGLALIANTAPVAFGAVGIPVMTLAKVTGLDLLKLTTMAGRQLVIPSFLIPGWIVVAMSGWKGLKGVLPAVLVCGGVFSITQLVVATYFGPSLVDIVAGLVTMIALIVLMKYWQPAENWRFPSERDDSQPVTPGIVDCEAVDSKAVMKAWMPWVLMTLFVFIWGMPQVNTFLSGGAKDKPNALHKYAAISIPIPGLNGKVYRNTPVVPKKDKPEPAIYDFKWLSATGTGILVAAMIAGWFMGISRRRFVQVMGITLHKLRWSLLTIACMLGLGYCTRFSGMDATLGLAFTKTGWAYPFFAAVLGWLGTAVTGSDTSSNALFGSLQRITAEQLHLNPILIAASNSTGGVVGKMLDAQSIVVSAAATNHQGEESKILRFVFWHSVALVCIMGCLNLLMAYVVPWVVPK